MLHRCFQTYARRALYPHVCSQCCCCCCCCCCCNCSPLLDTRRRHLGRFRIRYVTQTIVTQKYITISRSVTGADARESVQFTLELLTKHTVEEDIRGLLPLEALYRRNHGMHSAESMASAALHKPCVNDIFISTYPKCGMSNLPSTCTMHPLEQAESTRYHAST